jgi:hypothetical protein
MSLAVLIGLWLFVITFGAAVREGLRNDTPTYNLP